MYAFWFFFKIIFSSLIGTENHIASFVYREKIYHLGDVIQYNLENDLTEGIIAYIDMSTHKHHLILHVESKEGDISYIFLD